MLKRILVSAVLLICFTAESFAQNDGPPTCKGALQCEKMWSDAQGAIGALSNMRVRIATSDRVETYAPTGYGRVGVTLRKIPVGENEYEFRLDLECYGYGGCGLAIETSGHRLFNSLVRDR